MVLQENVEPRCCSENVESMVLQETVAPMVLQENVEPMMLQENVARFHRVNLPSLPTIRANEIGTFEKVKVKFPIFCKNGDTRPDG